MASLLSIKHDKITRELSKGNYNSKFLWKKVKAYIQELTQSKDTIVLSFDDSIQEKQYTDESELNCWHYDHVFGRSVKGVNFLTALVEVGSMRLPCCVEFIKKDRWVTDPKTGKEKRKSSVTGFAKSPPKTVKTQMNHYMLAIVAYTKLEWLKLRTNKNHFAMKAQIYLAAQQAAYNELQKLSTPRAA